MIDFKIHHGEPVIAGQNCPFSIYDLSVSPPRDYGAVWAWGDGSDDTDDPSLGAVHHAFAEPGSYTVSCTVTKNDGSDSGTTSVQVAVT